MSVNLINLDDPRWQQLTHAYGAADDVPAMLKNLQLDANDKVAWEEIWSALCHQDTVYGATYAAVPHLVKLAKASRTLKERAAIYQFVTYSFACSKYPDATPCPSEFLDAFNEALKELEALIIEDLKRDWPPLDLRYAVAGLLYLKGDPAGGKLLYAYDTLCDECMGWISPFKFSVETFK